MEGEEVVKRGATIHTGSATEGNHWEAEILSGLPAPQDIDKRHGVVRTD